MPHLQLDRDCKLVQHDYACCYPASSCSAAMGGESAPLSHSDREEEAMEAQWFSMPALAIPRPRELTQCSRPCPLRQGWEGTGTPVLQVESGGAEQATCKGMKGALVCGAAQEPRQQSRPCSPRHCKGSSQRHRFRAGLAPSPLPGMHNLGPGSEKDPCLQPRCS